VQEAIAKALGLTASESAFQKERLGHRPFTFDGVVVVADPPYEVVWEAPGFGVQGHHAFRFTPRVGGCVMQSAETFRGPGARSMARS